MRDGPQNLGMLYLENYPKGGTSNRKNRQVRCPQPGVPPGRVQYPGTAQRAEKYQLRQRQYSRSLEKIPPAGSAAGGIFIISH